MKRVARPRWKSLKHTACFEKNYRLQDIQLSKIRLRAFALRRDKVAIARESCLSRGGEYRARTGDLLVANQALSQLS